MLKMRYTQRQGALCVGYYPKHDVLRAIIRKILPRIRFRQTRPLPLQEKIVEKALTLWEVGVII